MVFPSGAHDYTPLTNSINTALKGSIYFDLVQKIDLKQLTKIIEHAKEIDVSHILLSREE